MAKEATSHRLSTEAKALLKMAAKECGISQQSVLEQAIRLFAKREGIVPTVSNQEEKENHG